MSLSKSEMCEKFKNELLELIPIHRPYWQSAEIIRAEIISIIENFFDKKGKEND